jgi:hypothetical protein
MKDYSDIIRAGPGPGCMVITAGAGGRRDPLWGGPGGPDPVALIATPGRPRMPRMREVARPVEVGAGRSTWVGAAGGACLLGAVA